MSNKINNAAILTAEEGGNMLRVDWGGGKYQFIFVETEDGSVQALERFFVTSRGLVSINFMYCRASFTLTLLYAH